MKERAFRLEQLEEDRDSPRAPAHGLADGAAVLLLRGRYHVAAVRSPLGRRLLSEGALHVADLSFAPDASEQIPATPPVRRVSAVDNRRAPLLFPAHPRRN